MVQSLFSDFCGFYCLHFIARKYGKCLPIRLKKFQLDNLEQNDNVVVNNLTRIFESYKQCALYISCML